MYKEDELKIGQGGNTDLCPFDCDCCTKFLHMKNADRQASNFPWNGLRIYWGMWRSVEKMESFESRDRARNVIRPFIEDKRGHQYKS